MTLCVRIIKDYLLRLNSVSALVLEQKIYPDFTLLFTLSLI
ncbi:hypothetical protein KL86DYS1_30011 [uncultured Dysgonomonas sp.]|uniref:Uncharacterized protein n=1 Tax=uncultured Dysgonomonas sp. TaxID=206096 RepID=A0A212JQ43_9BACT|nr:hypothetical protein KL86DYS1_30011 [uncultured Dysgonomonas sp.]